MNLDEHYEQFSEALLMGFDIRELERLVRFKLNTNLDHIVPPGADRQRVFNLIKWTETEGNTDALFIHALEKKPGNPKLKALAQVLAQETITEHQDLSEQIKTTYPQFNALESDKADDIRSVISAIPGNSGLQAAAVVAAGLSDGVDISSWIDNIESAQRKVCSIGLGNSHVGTGFLIDDNKVITNAHVLKQADISRVNVVFDFVGDAKREALRKYDVTKFLARSEPRELDFTLFELDETPEGNRGSLAPCPYEFKTLREPLHVIGHPDGKSLRMSYGILMDSNGFMDRIAYTANTQPGSSGSPVFRQNGELVALHHHGETGINNHGIPMRAILKSLTK